MSKRGRFMIYGSAVALVVAGTVCAAFIAGVTGQVLGMALLGTGLVILTGLAFMEVGLSEDRERERGGDRGPEKEPASLENERGSRENERGSRSSPPPRSRLDEARRPRVRGPRHER